MENESRDDILELPRLDEPAVKPNVPSAPDSELSEQRWSVISFERREAWSLTYSRAVELLSKLEADGITGLCIVTDEAAKRIRN